MALGEKLGSLGRFLKLLVRATLAVLFLFGWGLALLAVHVIVAPASGDATGGPDWRVIVVPKERLAITDTYADVRGWTADDVAAHPSLVARLEGSGKADALAHAE